MLEKVFANIFVLNTKTTVRELPGSFDMMTNFESYWPVIDSDFMWMLQQLWCLLCEPKDKQYKETTEKFEVNHSDAFKVLCICSRTIHQPDWQKQRSYLGQLNSLLIMCILPLQCGQFMYFELVWSHNQLCTFHTLINLLIASLFYSHA